MRNFILLFLIILLLSYPLEIYSEDKNENYSFENKLNFDRAKITKLEIYNFFLGYTTENNKDTPPIIPLFKMNNLDINIDVNNLENFSDYLDISSSGHVYDRLSVDHSKMRDYFNSSRILLENEKKGDGYPFINDIKIRFLDDKNNKLIDYNYSQLENNGYNISKIDIDCIKFVVGEGGNEEQNIEFLFDGLYFHEVIFIDNKIEFNSSITSEWDILDDSEIYTEYGLNLLKYNSEKNIFNIFLIEKYNEYEMEVKNFFQLSISEYIKNKNPNYRYLSQNNKESKFDLKILSKPIYIVSLLDNKNIPFNKQDFRNNFESVYKTSDKWDVKISSTGRNYKNIDFIYDRANLIFHTNRLIFEIIPVESGDKENQYNKYWKDYNYWFKDQIGDYYLFEYIITRVEDIETILDYEDETYESNIERLDMIQLKQKRDEFNAIRNYLQIAQISSEHLIEKTSSTLNYAKGSYKASSYNKIPFLLRRANIYIDKNSDALEDYYKNQSNKDAKSSIVFGFLGFCLGCLSVYLTIHQSKSTDNKIKSMNEDENRRLEEIKNNFNYQNNQLEKLVNISLLRNKGRDKIRYSNKYRRYKEIHRKYKY